MTQPLDLPDSALVAVPWTWLRERLAVESGGPEYGTTGQCAKIVGKSAKYWRQACEAGEVTDAWQDVPGGPWTIPIAAARAHLARQSAVKAPRKGIVARGPWKKAS